MIAFFREFPAAIAFVCGFLTCLLIFLLLLRQLEVAKPQPDDSEATQPETK